MIVPEAMYTFEGRLDSFAGARPTTKRRGSTVKSQKTVSWPLAKPNPTELAKAGFFYTPTASSHDNVTCFMCQKSLDGWEEEDDPTLEHLHHSKTCAWALIASVTCADDGRNEKQEDPLSESMEEARRATFIERWPHEGKKGWICKIEKMVEGGWYYCPTPESDDFVSCPYCNLALDGWEPKDKPLEEHRRRSPHCPFVDVANNTVKPKKKSRSSKASRISTQSNATIEPEIPPLEDLTLQEENTVLTTATDTSMAPTGVKKVTKDKKTTTKPKGRKTKARTKDAVEVNSVPEPENDSFEVKIEKPERATRGKKRKSSALDINGGVDQQEQIEENSVEIVAPAPKRRATKTRSSVTQQASGVEILAEPTNVETEDTAVNAFSIPIVSKKTSKTGGRKASTSSRRGSKRKASSASTASKASLRGQVPGDDELERALEDDLDRPLTDEEDQGRQEVQGEEEINDNPRIEKPSSTRKTRASVAPVRKSSRDSNAIIPLDESNQPVSVPAVVIMDKPPSISYPSLRNMLVSKDTKTDEQLPQQSLDSQNAADQAVSLPTQPKATSSPTPQSSDAENHPPSSRPRIASPPKSSQSTRRLPLTTTTTTSSTIISPTKRDMMIQANGIRSTGMAWTAIDLETIFLTSPTDDNDEDNNKENRRRDEQHLLEDAIEGVKGRLTSPEKAMTVEEWVHHNARLGEEKLRRECERRISLFEKEGNRALQVLEGIVVAE